jgi:hypothetical protein
MAMPPANGAGMKPKTPPISNAPQRSQQTRANARTLVILVLSLDGLSAAAYFEKMEKYSRQSHCHDAEYNLTGNVGDGGKQAQAISGSQ